MEFRTRARTVDMLGRQQIASLSTALSELFKNSHDAYATKATADLYRKDNLLVVSDDGVGMDRCTFEDAWLTIATESKLDRSPTPRPPGMSERRQLGEKGIGRFAIGALGKQVLVVSKRRDCQAIAALVNWQMFELPGIDLDEIPVGLIEMKSNVPDAETILRLKAPLLEAVEQFHRRPLPRRWLRHLDDIRSNIDALSDNPFETIASLVPIGESGTQFLISPVSDDFSSELEVRSWGGSLLARTLHGFTDGWMGRSSTLDFAVDVVDHPSSRGPESLLNTEEFFGASTFAATDHHIVGEFNATGDFVGTIRIFDTDPVPIEVNRPKTVRRAPSCGPFAFELGVLQGRMSESRLDPEAFTMMTRHLRQFGGVYVYMDGIRVQPYGRPDVDYLEIEERRTRSAGYYYFSYRRMVGAVTLTSDMNSTLEEKAGREGFTRGHAFSDFRRLLMNLFEQIASMFFRPDSPDKAYEKGRERLRREDELRRVREQQAAKGRRRLRGQLAVAVKVLNETDFDNEAAKVVGGLRAYLSKAQRLQPASNRIRKARGELQDLITPLMFREPTGFAPSEPMRRDMALVERGAEDVKSAYILPALLIVDDLANQIELRLGPVEADLRERERYISSRTEAASAAVHELEATSRNALLRLRTTVEKTVDKVVGDYEARLQQVPVPRVAKSEGWVHEQVIFEDELDVLVETSRRELVQVHGLIETIYLIFTTGAPTPLELAAAADSEILDLRARIDSQLELVQLGMALAVVDHEFQSTVLNIRADVAEVGRWAKVNDNLVNLYENLRRDFDHLDSYLTLLTPMQRRLRRTKTVIRGRDIVRFLRELFAERLAQLDAAISPTNEFRERKIRGFTSTFYPVFINLVDNSLYWIDQANSDKARLIELDTRGDALVYRDNGPGIARDIAERVFEFGFTTRPGGSGLGLAIASQVLDRADWVIYLAESQGGCEFVLRPKRGETT